MTGPNEDDGRNALARLGANVRVVPDETQPRLVYYEELDGLKGPRCAMHVVMPADPWWHFFLWRPRRPTRALTVMGLGTHWTKVTHVLREDGGWIYEGMPYSDVLPRTAAILALLWVNREKIVERSGNE